MQEQTLCHQHPCFCSRCILLHDQVGSHAPGAVKTNKGHQEGIMCSQEVSTYWDLFLGGLVTNHPDSVVADGGVEWG